MSCLTLSRHRGLASIASNDVHSEHSISIFRMSIVVCAKVHFSKWTSRLIKLRNVLVSLKKTSGHWISQISNNWLIMFGMRWPLGCYQKYTLYPSNIAKLKWTAFALLSIWNDFPHCRSSLIRQSRHFERDFNRVLLQLMDIFRHSLNTERAAEIRRWNVWLLTIKLCKVWFVITEYSLHVYLKKWTLNFKLVYLWNQECWILTCERCKFGGKICYNSRDIQCESKKSLLRTCGNISKTAGNFSTKFYMPITHSYLR